jgi:hypothetical protein
MNSSNLLKSSVKNTNLYNKMELSIPLEIPSNPGVSTIHELLILQDEKMNIQQQYLRDLSQGLLEIFTILSNDSRPDSISIETIEALKKDLLLLDQGTAKIYQHLDSFGKELKSGQQALQKAIEASQKKTNIGYLDWKQIATIITATAIISSLCSLAVFQLASNIKTDRTPTLTEKTLKTKKISK